MNTDSQELTDKEIYERDGLGAEFDRKYGMRMVTHNNGNGNGSYNFLKNTVFVAVIFGMGAIVWEQQGTNANFAREIAILKLECRNNIQERGLELP